MPNSIAPNTVMPNFFKSFCLVALVAIVGVSAAAWPAADKDKDKKDSIVIVFKDGHTETFGNSEIARIDFSGPAMVVFKDGRERKIPTADVARIEFQNTASRVLPARFVGKWEVGEGNGNRFMITLHPDGTAEKSIGATHGTWTSADGEARISWDDGWHDAIRKVGNKYEKIAYSPDKSFSDKPSNVTEAVNTEPRPI